MSYAGIFAIAATALFAGVVQAAQVGTQPEAGNTSVTFPDGVRGLSGAVYSVPAGARPQTLDLYLPASSTPRPASGFPLVVFIPDRASPAGSGMLAHLSQTLASLAGRGYVVAAMNYRVLGEARFPAQIEDVRAGLRWLRANAARFGIDSGRVVAWGVATGGHLAALAALSCENALTGNCLQGVVAWDGIFDLGTIVAQAAATGLPNHEDVIGRLLGCAQGACAEQINAASPVTYVSRFAPPMLLIADENDHCVPYQQTRQMADSLVSAGAHSEVHLLGGISHDFLASNATDVAYKATRYALERTFGFIDETIGNPLVAH